MKKTVLYDEDQCVAELKEGSETALVTVIKQYTPYVSAVVYNVAGERISDEDAEEIISDVFLILWKNAKKIRPGKLKAYLGTISRNRAKSALRQQGERLTLAEDVLAIQSPDPERELTQAEEKELLRQALDAMPEPDRSIFIRRYWLCQTVPAIAGQLCMNVNTVQTKLTRGRERLRLTLQKGGYTVE